MGLAVAVAVAAAEVGAGSGVVKSMTPYKASQPQTLLLLMEGNRYRR